MKVLIWILTIFIGTLLNNLIGQATGIKAGAMLLYLGEFFIARMLCEKWDEHLAKKASRERGDIADVAQDVQPSLNKTMLGTSNDYRDNEIVQESVLPEKNIFYNIKPKKIAINSKYGLIIFYADATSTTGVPMNYVGFCPQCGAAYGKDSECCDKCGTRLK